MPAAVCVAFTRRPALSRERTGPPRDHCGPSRISPVWTAMLPLNSTGRTYVYHAYEYQRMVLCPSTATAACGIALPTTEIYHTLCGQVCILCLVWGSWSMLPLRFTRRTEFCNGCFCFCLCSTWYVGYLWYIALSSTFFSSSHTSTFQLLDKPWSQVSSLLPPGSCLQFLSRIGFSNPTARRLFIECC